MTVDKAELQHDFDAVCSNESLSEYREFERILGRVARAIIAGWCPVLPVAPPRARQRAGYLMTVLADRGSVARPPVSEVAETEPVPFFHGDDPPETCRDALATRWGLTRGLNLSRVRQLLERPFAA